MAWYGPCHGWYGMVCSSEFSDSDSEDKTSYLVWEEGNGGNPEKCGQKIIATTHGFEFEYQICLSTFPPFFY